MARTSPAGSRPSPSLSPDTISRAVDRLAAPAGTDRYAAGKSLLATAEQFPVRVYAHFDALVPLLSSDNKIIRWTVQRLLASLACVDTAGKIDALLDRYLAFIAGNNMISAANAIRGSAQIARAQPHLLPRILPAIRAVETATYETAECRNVAIAHTLDAFKSLWPTVGQDPAVRAFVERQMANPRPAAARRARALLAKPASPEPGDPAATTNRMASIAKAPGATRDLPLPARRHSRQRSQK